MEAIVLAGGKATRLGEAARGRPKWLVPIAGRPIAAYHLAQLERAGVDRVIVSCARGQEELFVDELRDVEAELVMAPEDEPLGRGGGLRFAASFRNGSGPVFALNGDDLHDVDMVKLLDFHRGHGAAATLVVAPLVSSFGVVDIDEDDRIVGFREAPRLADWVSAGTYVLEEEALARLPERGDHEQSTFPVLAAEGKMVAFRHEGLWLPINTPKDVQRAEEHFGAQPAATA
jgi:NDP-sugar pyrophosphorylase family protein